MPGQKEMQTERVSLVHLLESAILYKQERNEKLDKQQYQTIYQLCGGSPHK